MSPFADSLKETCFVSVWGLTPIVKESTFVPKLNLITTFLNQHQMDFYTYSLKRDRLKFLITHRMVRTTDDIADKLELSKRTALRMIERLKCEGINVKFCRHAKGYVIEE